MNILVAAIVRKNELLTGFYYLFFTNHSSHDWFMWQSSGGHRFSKIGNIDFFLFSLSLWDSLYDTYIEKEKGAVKKKPYDPSQLCILANEAKFSYYIL